MILNLKNFKGFCLIKGDNSTEAQRLTNLCITKDIPLVRVGKNISCPKDYVPSGGVEWCLQSLGINLLPDYYPGWLTPYLHRKVWREDKWLLGQKYFVKPADKYKRFTGFVTFGTYSKKKKPPLIWSEVVSFTNEWRYYISNGKILCGEWYWGDEITMPLAPILDINIPKDFCGAVDFGTLKDGRLALVESHHPFSCGWYGSQDKDYIYFQWIVDGWEYLNKLKGEVDHQ
jgi:hypothetical protein